jgi:hypothetical protein
LKLKRFISKKNILNVVLFLFLLGTAWLFDLYHSDDIQHIVETEQESQTDQSVTYICSPIASISLKAPTPRVLLKKSVQLNINRHLMFHHSVRAFHVLKAEIPELPENILERNLIAFRNCHYCSPDDQPPLA